MPTLLDQTSFTVRRKVLKLFGGAFHIYDSAGNVIGYSKMKAFKLKEDIRLYTGEDMSQELLTIKARQMIDFAASYDVYDPQQQVKVGALRRRGLKSLIRDEWLILDPYDREMGNTRCNSGACRWRSSSRTSTPLCTSWTSIYRPIRVACSIEGLP